MTPSIDTTTESTASVPIVTPIGARPAVVVRDKGHSYFVDAITGEIIHSTRKLPRHRVVRSVDVYVGTDTRWPSEARDADELHKATEPFDWWPDQHYVNRDKFLDLLDRHVSSNAVRLLRHIAENLSGWNHWFGRMEEIAEALQMPTRTLERAMQELSTINAIQRKPQGRTWPVRISIHPWFAWKGDLLGRDNAYAKWIRSRPANFDGK